MDYMGHSLNGGMHGGFGGRLGGRLGQMWSPEAIAAGQVLPAEAPKAPSFFESIIGGAGGLLTSPAAQFALEERTRREAEAARRAEQRQKLALTTADVARQRAREAVARAREEEARRVREPKKAPMGLIIGGGAAVLGIIALVLFAGKRRR